MDEAMAAGKLLSDVESASNSQATQLIQDYWSTEFQCCRLQHKQGCDSMVIAERLAAAADGVVGAAYHLSRRHNTAGLHALVALGGYGRGEMAPFSDVDLLFLYRQDQDINSEFVAGVLHPLWNLGLVVGHSSRNLRDVEKSVRDDVVSCTAMMDSRLLAGDKSLFDQFRARLYRCIPGTLVSEIQHWRRMRRQDCDSVQLLEPNLKESPGGLRELHALEWALRGVVGSPDIDEIWGQYFDTEAVNELLHGRAFLWRVRHQLHFNTGRRHDILHQDLKSDIATALGYRDKAGNLDHQTRLELGVERFMRDYYLHARAIYHQTELAFARLTRQVRSGRPSILIEAGVAAAEGEIVLLNGGRYFAAEPVRLLRLFHLAQARNLDLGEAAQRCVRASLHLIDDQVRGLCEVRKILLRILRSKYRVSVTLRRMHQLGVLGAFLPEFGELTCLVRYDVYHIYTVDEHTLVALDRLDDLGNGLSTGPLAKAYSQLERRDLLFLGLLLHDAGKSKGKDHILSGLAQTRRLMERLAFPEQDIKQVLFLIEHHIDLARIAQRRDLDDYQMIAELAALFPDQETLRQLYLLTYADMAAVSPDVWNEWQGVLLWELYFKTSQQLESGFKMLEEQERASEALDAHLEAMRRGRSTKQLLGFARHVAQLPPRYVVAYGHEQIAAHRQVTERLEARALELAFIDHKGHTELVVCTRDQRQLLAKICGALAVNDLNILRADVYTRDDDIVLDIFQVSDLDGSSPLDPWKEERVRARLDDVVSLRETARDLLSGYSANWDRRKKSFPRPQSPVIQIENQVSTKFTVIDAEVQDDVGLLYAITHELAESNLDIHMAIVNTVAGRATDAFYVTDLSGKKILDFEFLDTIRERLLNRLSN